MNTLSGPADAPRLQAILESAVSAIITIDEHGIIENANRAVERMFGYATEELVGRNVNMLMPDSDARRHDGYIMNYLTTGDRKIIGIGREVMARRKDGGLFPLHLSVGEFYSEGRRFFTGILADMSQQRHAETRLAREEARFRSIFHAVPDAFVITDEARTVQLVNPAFTRMFGYQADEIVGRPVTMLMATTEDAEQHQRASEAAAEGRMPAAPLIISFQRKNGEVFPGETVSSRVTERAELGCGLVTMIRDVSVELKRRTAVRTAQRLEAIGQLTGGIAHDFNNLLTIVVGNLELLEPRLTTNDARELIHEVQEAADMGARLTQQLLTFARRQRLETQTIALNDFVIGMADLLRRTIGSNIDLVVSPAADLWQTKVDPGLVETTVVNLAINARDALPEGGKIVIETRNVTLDQSSADLVPGMAAGDYVVLSVTDNGHGMPAEIVERAFEPFFTTKAPGKGSGLGLASVYGFARQSGGQATLYSEIGRGTTVNIYLPRAVGGGGAVPAGGPVDRMMPGNGEMVLVVEDDPGVRKLTLQRLSELSYRAESAGDAPTALRMVRDGLPVDIVFTDYVMPGGMSGLDLARMLRAEFPGVRVLLTTGYASGLIDTDELDRLDIRVLRKPYRLAELARALQDTIKPTQAAPTTGGRRPT